MANDSNDGGNRAILQNGVQALMGIWNALLNMGSTTLGVSTVAGLPAVGTVPQGARRLVTDSNSTTFNATVAGGGSNIVPVFNNGTNWKIG